MTTKYTWRDCEIVLDALDDEPREIPALREAAKKHSEMVVIGKMHISQDMREKLLKETEEYNVESNNW